MFTTFLLIYIALVVTFKKFGTSNNTFNTHELDEKNIFIDPYRNEVYYKIPAHNLREVGQTLDLHTEEE